MEDSLTQYENLSPRQDKLNWVLCMAILFLFITASVYWMFADVGDSLDFRCCDSLSEVTVVCFNACATAIELICLIRVSFFEPQGRVDYVIPGRPDIPKATATVHQWSAFTIWCNGMTAIYFASATAVGILDIAAYRKPQALCLIANASWSIAFPLSFLVSVIVTYVLIPELKRQGRFDILWLITTWLPSTLHNGMVLLVATEAAIAAPPITVAGFPIPALFGCAYISFSLLYYYGTNIFHYFFLDPRFKFAPVAYPALIALFIGLMSLGALAVDRAQQSGVVRVIIVLFALATCKFTDSQAVEPEGL